VRITRLAATASASASAIETTVTDRPKTSERPEGREVDRVARTACSKFSNPTKCPRKPERVLDEERGLQRLVGGQMKKTSVMAICGATSR
jgi:hypothetical protein